MDRDMDVGSIDTDYEELFDYSEEESTIEPLWAGHVTLNRHQDDLDKLWVLWKRYIDYYVVGNHELKRVMFHSLLGVILTKKGWRYIVSGDKYCSCRWHCFIIQPSGTGKSETMKAWAKLLTALGIDARYTTHDNESYLIGSSREDKRTGELTMVKGVMSTLSALCWDEGEILLSHGVPFLNVDVLTAQFQSIMDEPGMVQGKGMRAGSVGYSSDCTIVAGSYMFDEFKETLLRKGFLQRMRVYFVNFTKQEKDMMSAGVELMKLQQNPEKIQYIRNKIKELVDRIPECHNKQEYMTFEPSAVMRWIPDKMKLKAEFIDGAYSGEKQDILETFFNRFHNIVDKVAVQRAIILGKKRVDYEDICYAKEQSVPHLKCVLECFDSVAMRGAATPDQNRTQIISNIVKKYDGITQTELLIELRNLKNVNKWDLGSNRTINLIDKLCDSKSGIFYIERGDKNVKKIHFRQKL